MPIVPGAVGQGPVPAGAPDLAAVKAFLNYPTGPSSDDPELLDALSAAYDIAESIVGPLRPQQFTETQPGGSQTIVLHRSPVLTVDSITVTPQTFGYWSYDTVNYGFTGPLLTTGPGVFLNLGAGLLKRTDGRFWPRNLIVTYTAGQTVTAAQRQGVLEIVGGLWESQRGADPLPIGGGDEITVDPSQRPVVPARALELLSPTALPPRIL